MSEALAPGEPASSVSVSPDQIKIDIELDREVFLDLTLTNNTDQLATFKVKTTARDRYLLRPTQDYIQPRATKVCKIVMCKMSQYPDLSNPKNLKDKFLVQSMLLPHEVPDLTKFWKEQEHLHNPKAGQFMYAETKIKCKLVVPAKLRAQDAAKRGQAEEAAAQAELQGKAVPAPQQQPPQQQQQQSEQKSQEEIARTIASTMAEPSLQARRPSTSALADPLESASNAFVPHAAAALPAAAAAAVSASPAITAPVATSSSAGASATDAAVSAALDAEKQRYSELMAFVVNTTKQLELERDGREQAEAKSLSAVEKVRHLETRARQAEKDLAAAREEITRLATATAAAASSKASDEGDATTEEGARRRKNAQSALEKAATAAATTPTSATSSTSTQLAVQPSGLTLQLWQLAILSLVCFVLGRIFA